MILMESEDVIASIRQIYARFPITENLAMHMCRAASVGELVYDHLGKKEGSRNEITAALLLHDLGNIVKFKLDPEHAHLLGREQANIGRWKELQAETINTYGTDDDHEVTYRMVGELGVSKRLEFITRNYWDIGSVEPSRDISLTICAYGDCRTGPYGILSVRERFGDLLKRYRGDRREHGFQVAFANALNMEKYLIERTDLSPEDVNDNSIRPYLEHHLSALGMAK